MGVGARSAAAAPFRLLQVLEVDRGEGRRQTRRIRRSRFDEAKLQRFGQQAGSESMRRSFKTCLKSLLGDKVFLFQNSCNNNKHAI